MSGINDRKKAMEFELHHDSETRFKIAMRRNKLLGHWAAEQLGLSDDDTGDYVKSVVQADFEEAGDEDVLRKVKTDFDAGNVTIDVEIIREKLNEFLHAAAEQIQTEG